MKVIIIEDETAAMLNLTSLLAEVYPTAEVCRTLESVTQSVEWFDENPQPDLVFMDIHLADGDAFRIFDRTYISSPIIFTTAYDQYALRAFEFNSIDYILKPIKKEELRRAIDKFVRLTSAGREEYTSRISSMVSERKNTMLIHAGDRLVAIRPEEIAFCYACDEKISIYAKDGRVLAHNRPLDTIMGTLPENDFFRANRQFIVARDAIADVTVWYGSRLCLHPSVGAPERIIISKARTPHFKRWLAD